MFNIEYEMNKNLTTEQISMILDLAAQAASDGGFISSYIFTRAIYVFAAQILYPEQKDDIAALVGAGYDIRLAFDTLVKNGTIQDMQEKYASDLEALDNYGKSWYDEVAQYQQSARGLIDSINNISNDIIQEAYNKLQKVASEDVEIVQNFVDKWGFNRPTPGETNTDA